jgi:glycosyltransferase involved in cell wall biosynthesis
VTAVPSLSVVIPSRDKASSLALTLTCLCTQTWPDVEVVVVDDGSRDTTADVIAAFSDGRLPLRPVRLDGRGRAAARNAGAAVADGDVVVFLDDDILVPAWFLAAHAAVHADPPPARAAALPIGPSTGRPILAHGPLCELPGARRLVEARPADPYRAARGGAFGRTVVNSLERLIAAMSEGRAPAVAPWLAGVGANLSVLRAAWRRSGGFDAGFGTGWGCEDLEFAYRLVAGGARTVVVPDADGVHLSHHRPDRWTEHADNFHRFRARHRDPAVDALPDLLSATGSPARYLRAASGEMPAARDTEGVPT